MQTSATSIEFLRQYQQASKDSAANPIRHDLFGEFSKTPTISKDSQPPLWVSLSNHVFDHEGHIELHVSNCRWSVKAGDNNEPLIQGSGRTNNLAATEALSAGAAIHDLYTSGTRSFMTDCYPDT